MARAAAWTLLLWTALSGCEGDARPLAWRIRFEPAELAGRAAVLDARIARGMCGEASGEIVYATVFALDEAAPVPARLPPGSYSIEAYARDASCVMFASDCVNVQLPTTQSAIELLLQERPGSPACAAGEACVAGACEAEPRRDAGPRDAAGEDAGARDGGVCPSGATDGTGTTCRRNTDCPAGLICHGYRFGSESSRCTRLCDAAGEACVAGWVCETAAVFECPDGCPSSPICRCVPSSLFEDGAEIACDGEDDDCDGRIDEVTADEPDPCGNGTCSCAGCTCDPGFTECNGRCVNTSTDPDHCGACGSACAAGFACSASRCVCNQTLCSGACVNTQTSEAHCGGCGNTCAGTTPRCCSGACVDLASDPSHCGSCVTTCAATELCCAGACTATTACP